MKTIKAFIVISFFVLTLPIMVKAEDVMIIDDVYVTGKEAERGESTEKNIGREVLKTHKVVDLAEILSDELIEASMIRKGAYGNEVAIRGFSQSNLGVFQDGMILEGACGSRKDPSLSHVAMLTVDTIEVKEGPFDVTKQGMLGGCINVITKKPKEGIHAETFGKLGSFDFWSLGGYVTGGSEKFKILGGYNYSESGQYKDGGGTRLSGFNPSYNDMGKKMKAFEKTDVWGKVEIEPVKNHDLMLSYSFGQGNDIMSPRVGMDMETERTNLVNARYAIKDLSDFSEELSLEFYHNQVGHYPYDKYRKSSITNGFISANEVLSSFSGGKIQNKQLTGFGILTYGTDMYYRKWDGRLINKDTGEQLNSDLFPNCDAYDVGAYLSLDKEIANWSFSAGIRGDWFYTVANRLIDGDLKYSKSLTDTNGHYDVLPSGYLLAKYYLNEKADFFAGAGHSMRTPTAVERYLQAGPLFYGNPDVKPTHNTEGDLGFELNMDKIQFRIKGFYSWLVDYVYQEGPNPKTWTNIDAYIAGGDVKALIDLMAGFSGEAACAYQRGGKYSEPRNNEDKNLAQIPPLKTKLALHYDSSSIIKTKDFSIFGTFEWVHSEKDFHADIDAGEEKIPGWNALNFRIGTQYKAFKLTFGIDNIANEKYAVANSYEYDVTSTTGATPLIVNEPGRFFYGTLSAAF